MLSKAVSSTIFWVFGITGPGIEPRSPEPLANTLLIQSIVIHRQTVSLYHNSSVVRYARCLKLGQKIGYLTPKALVPLGEGSFYVNVIYAFGYQRTQFMRRALHLRICGSRQFSTRVLNPRVCEGKHIYCHRVIDCFVVL